MLDNALLRRLVTVPSTYLLFGLITGLFPVLLAGVVVVDAIRWSIARRPWMATRILLFAWVYLLGEAWALIALGFTWFLGSTRSVEPTYALQRAWAAWNFRTLAALLGLEFEVTGNDSSTPGPILLLSRHASMIDTLIPAEYVTRPFGIRLRYVLKKELLLDPALDIAGNRLPNHFVDRGTGDSEAGLRAIRFLANDLQADEGILIYPEGTRYSKEKRIKYTKRLSERAGRVGAVARSLNGVLPPRPGGTLALLEASPADVVVLAHRGLEGFAKLKDIWRGDLVGRTIVAHFDRIARSEIPTERAARVEWLFDLWARVDTFVGGDETVAEGA